jgi:hypothetical protein
MTTVKTLFTASCQAAALLVARTDMERDAVGVTLGRVQEASCASLTFVDGSGVLAEICGRCFGVPGRPSPVLAMMLALGRFPE